MLDFTETLHRVEKHNQKYKLGEVPFTIEVNEFAHLDFETFATNMMGAMPSLMEASVDELKPYAPRVVPTYFNWTARGAVNNAVSQGHCGSCYIFGSIAAIEGAIAIKYKKLVKLSEQQYLQCAVRNGVKCGCKGGWDDDIYIYSKDVGGITTIGELPYTANDSKPCDESHPKVRESIVKKFVRLPRNDEKSLQIHLATIGPVSAAFHASHSLGHYKQGIFNDPDHECNGKGPNHMVLIVGYGTDKATGLDYFIAKNSWGQRWGENGFFRIARNNNNLCKIAGDAKFPTII